MMKRALSVRVLALCGCAIAAGCGISASSTGLTPGFEKVARAAHIYITSELIPVGRMPQFPAALAESRARVKAAETQVVNDADRGVWLIMMMINAKAGETRQIYELEASMGQRPATSEALKDVVKERTQCLTELEGWLSPDEPNVELLQRGTCLQLAKHAAAILRR